MERPQSWLIVVCSILFMGIILEMCRRKDSVKNNGQGSMAGNLADFEVLPRAVCH